jgi:hypothetical protein
MSINMKTFFSTETSAGTCPWHVRYRSPTDELRTGKHADAILDLIGTWFVEIANRVPADVLEKLVGWLDSGVQVVHVRRRAHEPADDDDALDIESAPATRRADSYSSVMGMYSGSIITINTRRVRLTRRWMSIGIGLAAHELGHAYDSYLRLREPRAYRALLRRSRASQAGRVDDVGGCGRNNDESTKLSEALADHIARELGFGEEIAALDSYCG